MDLGHYYEHPKKCEWEKKRIQVRHTTYYRYHQQEGVQAVENGKENELNDFPADSRTLSIVLIDDCDTLMLEKILYSPNLI